MASTEYFYSGGNYPLSKDYGEHFLHVNSRYPVSSFGFPTDPRSSNQLGEVSKKFATGAKTIEVSGVQASEFESMPQHHLKEINRLKKLVGADLTFHGPIVEPTGVTKQGWDPTHREQAERQMWSAVKRAHDLEPDGNIVITFHSSASLPEPETKVYDEKKKKWITKEMSIVDERTGQFDRVQPKTDYFRGGEDENPMQALERMNKERWLRDLQHANFNAYAGYRDVKGILEKQKNILEGEKDANVNPETLKKFYKLYTEGKGRKIVEELGPNIGGAVNDLMQSVTHGHIYLREAYQNLQDLYNQAYDSAKKDKREDDLKKLDQFQGEIAKKLDYIDDPAHVEELGKEIIKGINVLHSIHVPQKLRPLKDFAVAQASETFSNLALKGYKEFKDTAPIISVENPPAGAGLNRADDLRDLMKASRERFIEKAKEQLGMSQSQAEKQAEKLIGITWDVGHINMIRKFGAEEQHLLDETKSVAPYVKHIHLSDNFGMEHTELPMGMGNVPIKKEMEILEKYGKKVKEIKKIVETGGPWFRDFKMTPMGQTLSAFGSPVYSMSMAPYWNQAMGVSGAYFAGRGFNPDVHHTYFGSGYTNLPLELGGQASGRSRLSGTPTE